MMRKKTNFYAGIFYSVILLTSITTYAWSNEEYRIGAILPISGSLSKIGISQLNSLSLLAEQINSKGGVHGSRIKIIKWESNENVTNAIAGMKMLIEGYKVAAIIGPSAIGETKGCAQIALRHNIPLISLSFNNIDIDKKFQQWVFQSAPKNTLRIDKTFENLKQRKIPTISLIGPSHLGYYSSYALEKAKALGIKIISDFKYNDGEIKYYQMNKFLENSSETQAFIAYDLKLDLTRIGWDNIEGKKLFYVMFPMIIEFNVSPTFPKQSAIQMITPIFHFSKFMTDKQLKVVQDFSINYRMKFHDRITIYNAVVHDAFMILIEALRSIGPNKMGINELRRHIRDKIESLVGFNGAIGEFNFSKKNHNGLSSESCKVLKVDKKNVCTD